MLCPLTANGPRRISYETRFTVDLPSTLFRNNNLCADFIFLATGLGKRLMQRASTRFSAWRSVRSVLLHMKECVLKSVHCSAISDAAWGIAVEAPSEGLCVGSR